MIVVNAGKRFQGIPPIYAATRQDGTLRSGRTSVESVLPSSRVKSFPYNIAVMLLVGLLHAAPVWCQSTAGQADSDQDEQVFDLTDDITPPRVVHQVAPRHVRGSQGFRVGGIVVVGLVVTSKGLTRNVHVVKSLDKEVDASAIDAVREWRFDPAKKDAKPVAVNVTVEIRFHDM